MSAGVIVIAGGGTGGHVMPALAIAEQLERAGEALLFVGTDRGLERRLVPEAGYPLVTFASRPLVGQSLWKRLLALLALALALPRALLLLRARRARLLISVGGYASAPATLAAWLARIPIVVINCDAAPGLANRLLARLAQRIHLGFEAAATAFDARRVRVSGVPLRAAFRSALEADAPGGSGGLEPQPGEDERLHLFAFGGSLGARQLNDALLAAASELDPNKVAVVHQTGARDLEPATRVWRAHGFSADQARVVAFERDMPARYRWADLVVCRAGAVSVAEIALAGRAALLLPLAHTGGGEQAANARELERAKAARVLDGATLRHPDFCKALLALLADPAQLRAMGRAAARLARPDAATTIARDCRALAGGRR